MQRFNLSDCGFSTDNFAYVIAEIGLNHRGDLDTAKLLVESAARAGVDAVKFQTYLTEKRVPVSRPDLYQTFKQLELPFEAFDVLKRYSESLGVDFITTAFDIESVEFLTEIKISHLKVASFDVNNHQLLEAVAKANVPVILSVGMASLEEIDAAYNVLSQSTEQIALLHCVSAYPTPESASVLANMDTLRSRYECVIGQSDHTDDIEVPLYAVAAGAQIIEKHFRIDSEFQCIDEAVSITEEQTLALVNKIRRLGVIFGSTSFGVRSEEDSVKIFRRSSVSSADGLL